MNFSATESLKAQNTAHELKIRKGGSASPLTCSALHSRLRLSVHFFFFFLLLFPIPSDVAVITLAFVPAVKLGWCFAWGQVNHL